MQNSKNKKQKMILTNKALQEAAICEDFALRYDLHTAGWATIYVKADGQELSFSISYLHDSLGQLVDTALGLVNGELSDGTVAFLSEPGEMQLFLLPKDDLLQVTVTCYTDWDSWGMSSTHQVLKRFLTATKCFAYEVKNLLDDLYVTYGEAGYKERWVEADFLCLLM